MPYGFYLDTTSQHMYVEYWCNTQTVRLATKLIIQIYPCTGHLPEPTPGRYIFLCATYKIYAWCLSKSMMCSTQEAVYILNPVQLEVSSCSFCGFLFLDPVECLNNSTLAQSMAQTKLTLDYHTILLHGLFILTVVISEIQIHYS